MAQRMSHSAFLMLKAAVVLAGMVIFWFSEWPDGIRGPLSTGARAGLTGIVGLALWLIVWWATRGEDRS